MPPRLPPRLIPWLPLLAAWLGGCAGGAGSLASLPLLDDDDSALAADDDDATDDDDDTPEPPPPLCLIRLDCPAEIPDEPKLDCFVEIEDGAGEIEYVGPMAVELRGRSSASFPKKQYGTELRDKLGADASVNLLGMGADPDWVLNGMWIDRSLMRNKLLFDLFRSFGGPERYAPESAHCELTLNGAWSGIYLLTERIKRDDDRVDIAADDGTGGSFVLKQDDAEALQPVGSAHGHWKLVYPSAEIVTSTQAQAIRLRLAEWEGALAGAAGLELFEIIDRDSFVDFVLLQEFAKNNDAYFLSIHVWADAGGPIHFTPWDLDLSFGQPNYNNNHPPEGWILYRPALVQAALDQPGFRAALTARWAELRADALSEDAISARMDRYETTLAPAVDENFEVWPLEDVLFLGEALYPVASWADELEQVRAWIQTRLLWIDDNLIAY